MEQNRFGQWVKEHKTQLLVIAGGVVVAVLVVVAAKHQEEAKQLLNSVSKLKKSASVTPTKHPATMEKFSEVLQESDGVAESVEEVIVAIAPYIVNEHIRNLHSGWKASQAKITEASEKGIHLLEGQTLVNSYMKGGSIL